MSRWKCKMTVAEFRELYENDAPSDVLLNEAAICIYDELERELTAYIAMGNMQLRILLQEDWDKFNKLIVDIKQRRHAHALDAYDLHVKKSRATSP